MCGFRRFDGAGLVRGGGRLMFGSVAGYLECRLVSKLDQDGWTMQKGFEEGNTYEIMSRVLVSGGWKENDDENALVIRFISFISAF